MPRIALLIALALAALACQDAPDPNLVRVSGHVEATDVRVASEVGGRIVNLPLKEGDRVDVGAIVLRLDTRDAELAIDRARAEQRAAEAQLRLLQAGSRPEEIRQSDAQAQAARDEGQAARAELASAEADLQRFEALLEANAGSRKQRDDARTRRDVARERVQAADSRLRAAEQGTVKLRSGARPQEIEAARARVAAAATQVAAAEELLKDSEVHSPARGVVSEKLAEIGEVIAPRSPVLVITDLDNAWADVYVPEPVIPRLRLGQAAKVFTDAGGSGLEGSVTYISPKAEFTPRNVQTAEERSKLVYRVRISVDNKEGVLKTGMPVEAEIPLAPVDSAPSKPGS
jgi:HlyD family secretion protein